VVDYLFASHNAAISVTPILSGAVFHNKTAGMCDIHLIRFRYQKDYQKLLEKEDKAQAKFLDLLSSKQSAIESHYPALVG